MYDETEYAETTQRGRLDDYEPPETPVFDTYTTCKCCGAMMLADAQNLPCCEYFP